MDIRGYEKQAVNLLRQACSSYGILASSLEKENYRRLWARDSMIAGISALLVQDEEALEGFRRSIKTLADHQHPHGMIASNVLPGDSGLKISYGGLAGRVDATTWFVIGACLYLLDQSEDRFKKELQPHLREALDLLDRWEFNGKGLLYTPLSGNWSDEYPVQGHTFYDNLLRLWGLKLYSKLYQDEDRMEQACMVKDKICINYWPVPDKKDHPLVYHPREYEVEAGNEPSHYASGIDPTGYNMQFDAAAHGLALLLGLSSEMQTEHIRHYTEEIFREVGISMVPAFWPSITPEDDEWHDLKNNYSYYFKNQPHHFQNGGIWPVWTGLLGLGFDRAGQTDLAEVMLQAWMEVENPGEISFCEYFTSDTHARSGKQRLSFSAAGLLFLTSAINQNYNHKLNLEL